MQLIQMQVSIRVLSKTLTNKARKITEFKSPQDNCIHLVYKHVFGTRQKECRTKRTILLAMWMNKRTFSYSHFTFLYVYLYLCITKLQLMQKKKISYFIQPTSSTSSGNSDLYPVTVYLFAERECVLAPKPLPLRKQINSNWVRVFWQLRQRNNRQKQN